MPERSDISVRGIVVGAAIVIAGIGASLGLAALVAAHVSAPATGASAGEPPRIEGAALQTAPPQDYIAYAREKSAWLHGRGPIEGDAAHLHIPIDDAMRLMVERSRR
jgi:hypothetical protein